MGYILLGHGSLDLDPERTPPGTEIVGIPQGTRIQFYTDVGQGLVFDATELGVWDRLTSPWPPLDCSNVTYNLTLDSARRLEAAALRHGPLLGGHQLVRAGLDGFPDPLLLCTGTPRTCPTDTRQAAAGARHRCDGALGRLQGHDLHWLACALVEPAGQEPVDTVTAGLSDAVLLGEDPYWVPDASDHAAIERVNRANAEAAGDGETLPYLVGGSTLLIGEGHTRKHEMYARHQGDSAAGWCDVYRGGETSAVGLFHMWTVPLHHRPLVEECLKRLSDTAEVAFV
ncbi:hypothetical protein [Streptomyces sp. NPDC001594]|uniref:hypothetical protein n=1 Tax=Streptomyces sp. NPDC001594 TaxID=3364590 RepID=UPI0036CB0E7C